MAYFYHFTRPCSLRSIARDGLCSYLTECDILRGDRWHYLYCFSEVVDEFRADLDWGFPWLRFPKESCANFVIEKDPAAQNRITYRIKHGENCPVVIVHPDNLSVAIARDQQERLVFEPLPNLENEIHRFGWKSEFLASVDQTKAFFRKLNPDPARRVEPFPPPQDPIPIEELLRRISPGQIRLN